MIFDWTYLLVSQMMESSVVFNSAMRCVLKFLGKESDLTSDLPIITIQIDAIAQRYQVASPKAIPMPITS